jgi:hypothetical protein
MFFESKFGEVLMKTPVDDLRDTQSFGRLATFTSDFCHPGQRLMEKFDLICVPIWRNGQVDLLTCDLSAWQLTWYETSTNRESKENGFPTIDFIDRFELFLIREIRSKGGQLPSHPLSKRLVELVQGLPDANGGVLVCLLASMALKPHPTDPTAHDLNLFRQQLHDYYCHKLKKMG